MPSSADLGKKTENTVSKLVAKGSYDSRRDVLREGVRLVEARDKASAQIEAALQRGIADAEAGRVSPAEDVFARLEARYRSGPSKTKRKTNGAGHR
jgi:antitoxin ParD1/3/4